MTSHSHCPGAIATFHSAFNVVLQNKSKLNSDHSPSPGKPSETEQTLIKSKSSGTLLWYRPGREQHTVGNDV